MGGRKKPEPEPSFAPSFVSFLHQLVNLFQCLTLYVHREEEEEVWKFQQTTSK